MNATSARTGRQCAELSEQLEGLAHAGFGELLQVRSVDGAINGVVVDATGCLVRRAFQSYTYSKE
ncbi:hypothetical protein [Streptomyces sp. PSAA01]|uniref:hypothetical protein n=1 Tax=Streptomyces sp. PSAA01 TaxID=2912762 RepID=UPI001F3DC941|nr:hypothetical protein [Streptomyces sp. PSAA01]MCG0289768.1 hypothetical protein [Streptomyces sp. PSAA01]